MALECMKVLIFYCLNACFDCSIFPMFYLRSHLSFVKASLYFCMEKFDRGTHYEKQAHFSYCFVQF